MLRCTVSIALSMLLVASVDAATIRHQFSGELQDVRFFGADPFGGAVAIGTPFWGFYEFDGTQLPAVGTACQVNLSQCRREFQIPPYRFNVILGSITVEGQTELEIVVTDDQTGVAQDFYNVYGSASIPGWLSAPMNLSLLDSTHTAISDPRSLYFSPPDLSAFDATVFQIVGSLSEGYIGGTLNTLVRYDAEDVSLPATTWLLASTLGIFGYLGRRRNMAQR